MVATYSSFTAVLLLQVVTCSVSKVAMPSGLGIFTLCPIPWAAFISLRNADVNLGFWWQHCLKVECFGDVSVILHVSISK